MALCKEAFKQLIKPHKISNITYGTMKISCNITYGTMKISCNAEVFSTQQQ
jgi:hypothetical protein